MSSHPEPSQSLPGTCLERLLEILEGPEEEREQRLGELRRRYPEHVVEIERCLEVAKGGEDLEQLLASCASVTPESAGGEIAELPDSVGPYRILSMLGEGGMGTVYLAEQKEPVRRRVALKLIRLGMASDEVLRRFRAEQQALAMMNHDNIAKVFEAGTTEQGQPYFVMEHAPGLPITEHCDRHRLTTKDRLELFQQVCAGVQHAHQKGVIHRDLKPSNVLVTVQQGKPVPKIIDFGLARATDHRLVEATIFTEQGRIIGTPEYMSPEQAEMSSQDIDTRTDIYSLGVLLYELLVGELPFPRRELREAGLLEVQRKIREDDPPKPSTRLTSLGPDSEQAAKLRGTRAALLLRELRDGLDWVVMRAMEKERNRRYATASALDEDLARYLAGEPVLARPPSTAYRLRKFVRRYRVQVASGLAVLVALLAAAIGITLFGLQADASARQAREERKATGRALRRARAVGLANASAAVRPVDPMRALLLAREAARIEARPEIVQRLREAIQASLERALLQHGGQVTSALFSPSGDRILTASPLDKTTRIWNLAGKELAVLRHEMPVSSAAFSPSGDRILVFTTSSDKTGQLWDLPQNVLYHFWLAGRESEKTVRLWDLAGRELAVLRGHWHSMMSAVLSPSGNRILTASRDKTARLWDLAGRKLAVLRGHQGWVMSAVFSPSGDRILTASSDRTARLWDLSGKVLAILHGHEAEVISAEFSPSGDHILTASLDGTARLWDIAGKQLAVLRGHEGRVWSAVFSPPGDRILTASRDETARVWDLSGKELAVLRGHRNSVRSAVFSPSGDRILTASDDNSARLWDIAGRELAVLRGQEKAVSSALFSPTGDRVLTMYDETTRLLDPSGKELAVLQGHKDLVVSAVSSPSGDRILTASEDKTARLWDLAGNELVILRGHGGRVWSAVFSLSGDRILTASDDKTARLWDLAGNQLAVLRGHEGPVLSAVFSPSGDRILTASDDNSARLWDIAGKKLAVLRGHRGPVQAVFSPSGHHILTALDLNAIARRAKAAPGGSVTVGTRAIMILWDLEGNELAVLRGNVLVSSAVFSPSGDRILTASWHGTARLWDIAGNELAVLRGHEGSVQCAVFSPSGDRILTASDDKTARLWDLTGNELAVLRGHQGPVSSAVFSPSGDRILTASEDGTARLWLVHAEDLLKLADERITRDFTEEERKRYAELLQDQTTIRR